MFHWQVLYLSALTDRYFTCQWLFFTHWQVKYLSVKQIISLTGTLPVSERKLYTDRYFTCQCIRKTIKFKALTRKTLVKDQKIWKWAVEAFYCWQVLYLSVLSKNNNFPEKNEKIITWQVLYLSALMIFLDFFMHWQVKYLSVI